MLTQDDLKHIQKIISDEIGLKTDPLSKDIRSLQSDVQSLTTSAKSLETDVQSLKTDNLAFRRNFTKIHKDMNLIINFFDHEYLELLGRVERIEKHLGISALS
jgi:predicted RNase H-like nuclease (RuvC/YqgF family)